MPKHLLSLAQQLLLFSFFILSSCSGITVETKNNFEVVDLPDGSTVYMNRNSTLEYNENFEPRELEINGEFYFSVVAHEYPFIITTNLGLIRVIGTEFSVKSNKEEVEVEVQKGTVELEVNRLKHEIKRGGNALFKEGEEAIQVGKSKLKFKKWMSELKVEFKKMGREVKDGAKEFGKQSKKFGDKLKKELKD